MFFESLFSRSKRAAPASDHGPNPDDLRELARRTVPRDVVDFQAVLSIEALGEVEVRLMDVSPYGFQARARSRMLERGERLTVVLPLVGELNADIMWGLKGLFGCKFISPVDPDVYAEMLAAMREPGANSAAA